MITTKQKVSLGGLFVAAGAVWAPQVLQMVQGDTQSQVGVEAGPDEAEMLSIEQEMMGGGPDDGLGFAPPPTQSYEASVEEPSRAEGSQPSSVTPLLGESESSAVIGEVLRTLGQSEAFGFANRRSAAIVEEPVEEAEEVEEEEAVPQLLAFLEENPLRGTIVGENTSMALIGKRRVRLGEMIPGTAARLTSVGRGRATIEEEGMSVEIELAPLETDAAQMRAREAAASAAAGAASGAASIPGAVPGGTPTGDAASAPGATPNQGTPISQEGAQALLQQAAAASDQIPNPQGDF